MEVLSSALFLLKHLQLGSHPPRAQLWEHPGMWPVLQRVQYVHSGLLKACPRLNLAHLQHHAAGPLTLPDPMLQMHPLSTQALASATLQCIKEARCAPSQPGLMSGIADTSLGLCFFVYMFLLCKLALNVLVSEARNYISVHCREWTHTFLVCSKF